MARHLVVDPALHLLVVLIRHNVQVIGEARQRRAIHRENRGQGIDAVDDLRLAMIKVASRT